MGANVTCVCADRKLEQFRKTYWVILVYHGNYSAFSGGRFTPSDYSEIRCKKCNGVWRTKAAYVDALKHI